MADRKGRHEAVVKIACIQMEPVVGEKQRNLSRSIEFIGTAAKNGADLVVLPELCNSGYVFETREEAFSLSEEIPSRESTLMGGSRCEAQPASHCRHRRARGQYAL